MAKPIDPIVVWAAQDVNLPGTGRPNKSKPIDDLLAKGYDKGQKPAAEEFNFVLNQSTGWIHWIVNEKFPELEAEIARLLAELEERINAQISIIKQDIATIKQDIADLRRYVDQKVTELKQEIQGVRNDLDRLRQEFDAEILKINTRIDDLEPRLVPIGAVLPWPGTSVPDGWLECNGQVFNTGQNPKLYGVLGRNVVPDYRGLFLRGWAHGSGSYDPDYNRAAGSIQRDAMQPIVGTIHSDKGLELPSSTGVFTTSFQPKSATGHTSKTYGGATTWTFNSALVTRTAPETRPQNVAVMYIIKTDQAQSSGTNSPTGIVVSPDSVTNRVGFTVKATANVLPASLAGQYPVTWTSQNNAVATVDGSGNIRLVGPGETNIIASIATGMNVQIRITSYSVLTAVSISDPGPLTVPESKTLVINKTPSNANEPLQFLSNNSGIATVNDSGIVTAVSAGNVTITVRGTLSGISSTRSVTILPEEIVPTLEDVRLGVEQQTPPSDDYDTPVRAPAGCVITGMRSVGLGLDYGYYKPIQKKVSGVWVTVEG